MREYYTENESLNLKISNRKVIAWITCILLIINALTPIAFPTIEGVYGAVTGPSKIAPIDGSVDSGDVGNDRNIEWYTGTFLVKGQDDTPAYGSDRYKAYNDKTPEGVPKLGTETQPYIICTGTEMMTLAKIVNGTYGETNAKLTDNFKGKHIVLSGSAITDGIPAMDLIAGGVLIYNTSGSGINGEIGYVSCDSSNNGKGWNPIGVDEKHAFQGNIKAKNPDTGINIHNLSSCKSDAPVMGLFGYVGQYASVNGIHMKDVQIYAEYETNVGAIGAVVDPNAKITSCSAMGLKPGERTTNALGTALAQNQKYTVPDFTIFSNSVAGSGNTAYVGGLIGSFKSVSEYEERVVNALTLTETSGGGINGGGSEAPAGGQASADSEAPASGQAPADSEAPASGQAPAGRQAALPNQQIVSPNQPVFPVTRPAEPKQPDPSEDLSLLTDVSGAGVRAQTTTIVAVSHQFTTDAAFMGTVKNMVMVTGKSNVVLGGIVGATLCSGSAVLTIQDSSFLGKFISASTKGTGGILGYNDACNVKITNPHVEGMPSSMGAAVATAGALEMYITGSGAGSIVGISNAKCKVTGNLNENINVLFLNSVEPTSKERFYQIGGVMGNSMGDDADISDCNVNLVAIGRLNSENGSGGDYGGIGGILGFAKGSGTNGKSISNCTTKMDIKIAMDKNKSNAYIGGILGRGRNVGKISVTSCSSIDTKIRKIDSYTSDVGKSMMVMGGIVGGVNENSPNSLIDKCVVSNWSITCDGLVGGIVGTGISTQDCNITNISDCRVLGFDIKQGAVSQEDTKNGGITPYFSGGTISDCVVENYRFDEISSDGSYPYMGGIAGQLDGSGTITNCVANSVFRFGNSQGSNAKPACIGGIVGYLGGNPSIGAGDIGKVSNCGATIDFKTVKTTSSFEHYSFKDGNMNTSTTSIKTESITEPEKGYYYVGGIAGTSQGTKDTNENNISNSFATGNLEVDLDTNNENAIGGIVGFSIVNTRVANVFSTCSLNGRMQDAIGGICGFNYKDNVSAYTSSYSHCWYGGALLDPWAGSIVGFSNSGKYSNLCYNNTLSPNKEASKSLDPIAATGSAITAGAILPTISMEKIKVQTGNDTLVNGISVKERQGKYYDIACADLFTIAGDNSTAPSHVFSMAQGSTITPADGISTSSGVTLSLNPLKNEVNPLAEVNEKLKAAVSMKAGEASAYANEDNQKTETFTVSKGGISVKRDVKFIKRMNGHDSENGTTVPYKVTSKSGISVNMELNNMQQYVAIGGGFLGAKFELGSDISETLTKPIGMANTNAYLSIENNLPFCGSLDGKGKTINITGTSTPATQATFNGIFGYGYLADFKNVNVNYKVLTNITANGSNRSGAGGLLGYGWQCTIDGVNVSAPKGLTAASSGFGGIIGYGASTTVTNSSFTGDLLGKSDYGGIMGYSEAKPISMDSYYLQNSKIYEMFNVSASVGVSYVAGNVGKEGDDDSAKELFSKQNVGGIVGVVQSAPIYAKVVSESFLFGNVYGSRNVGGLMGRINKADSTTSVYRSYVRGNVYAAEMAGGIVGNNISDTFKIDSCYFAGQINCPGTMGAACGNTVERSMFSFDKQLAGNIWVLGAESEANPGNGGMLSSVLDVNEKPFTGSDTTVADGYYPSIPAMTSSTSIKTKEISKISTKIIYDFGKNQADKTNNAFSVQKDKAVTAFQGTISNSDVAITENDIRDSSGGNNLSNFATKSGTTYTNNKNSSGTFKGTETWTSPYLDSYNVVIKSQLVFTPFDGAGSKNNKFKIPDVDTLKKFRDYINNVFCGRGQHFELTMTASTAGNEKGYIYNLSGAKWTPIGTAKSPFMGKFFGNNKLISNMTIDNQNVAKGIVNGKTEYAAGLFGYVSQGTIDDVTVEGNITIDVSAAENSSKIYTGLLVGKGQQMTVSNAGIRNTSIGCKAVEGTQELNTYIGGMAGYAGGSSTFSDCYVNIKSLKYAVSVTGKEVKTFVGGLLGGSDAGIGETTTIGSAAANVNIVDDSGTLTVQGHNDKCSAVGGIVGHMKTFGQKGTIVGTNTFLSKSVIKNSAAFGNAQVYRGNVGGIIGEYFAENESDTLNINNCASTSDLNVGDETSAVRFTAVGGIAGYISKTNLPKCEVKDSMYSGTIAIKSNAAGEAAAEKSVGGLIGMDFWGRSNTTFTNTVYDIDKNYSVYYISKAQGRTENNAPYGVTTGALCEAGGTYKYDVMGKTGWNSNDAKITPNFLSDINNINKFEAEKVITGQSIVLNIVRTSSVAGSETIPGASSLYVQNQAASVTVSSISNGSGGADPAKTIMTAGNKRIVSKETKKDQKITAKVVALDTSGKDTLEGYGKETSYYPSIMSVGREDQSYIIANPTGDGIKAQNASFNIYTADQLMGMSNLNLKDVNLYVENDISFENSNYPSKEPSIWNKAYEGKVIGQNAAKPFMGSLKGQYHLIRDRNININTSVDPTKDAVGIFGYTSGASITNIGLVDSVIKCQGAGGSSGNYPVNIGSFIGSAQNTTMSGVFSSARLEQENLQSQGLVKYVNIGGLVGNTKGIVDISRVYFTGSLGLTGNGNSAYPSYKSGTAGFYAGGFVGSNGGSLKISNGHVASYIYGYSTDDKNNAYGAFLGKPGTGGLELLNCFYDESANMEGIKNCGTADISTGKLVKGQLQKKTIDGFTTTNGGVLYPYITGFKGDDIIASVVPVDFNSAASSISNAKVEYSGAAFGNGYYPNTLWGIPVTPSLYEIGADNKSLVKKNNGLASVNIKYGKGQRMVTMNMKCWYDDFKIEDGKKVYTIKNVSELEELANLIKYGDDKAHVGHGHANHGGSAAADFDGATIKLGADIMYNTAVTETPYYIQPIGTPDKPFNCTFDGNGYLFVNPKYDVTKTSESAIGIFGYTGANAIIKNVGVTGEISVDLVGSGTNAVSAGAIVGVNKGVIQGCYNGAGVKLASTTENSAKFGGICGENSNAIKQCYNMGHIIAQNDGMIIGGIVGVNNQSSTLSDCYNTGIITGYTNLTDKNYVNRTVIGGIAGMSAGTVSTSYNAGVLENYKAEFLNPIANGGTIKDCIMDKQMYKKGFGGNVAADGVTGVTTLKLSGASAPSTAFSEATWEFKDGYYPMLKAFTAPTYAANSTNCKLSSYVSAIAARTSGGSTDPSTFDNFNVIKFDNYNAVSSILAGKTLTIDHNIQGNQITFDASSTASQFSLAAKNPKQGSANVNLYVKNGDYKFLRETTFFGENKYDVRYLFDFSDLIKNSSEGVLKTPGTTDTFFIKTNSAIDETKTTGTGTGDDPYLITTAEDMGRFATYINNVSHGGADRYFVLNADISFNGKTYTPVGTETKPFMGEFSGDGHKISGIKKITYAANCVGVFGNIGDRGTVELLAVEDSNFTSNGLANKDAWVGALAGRCSGVIRDCYSRSMTTVTQSASAAANKLYAGGLVGEVALASDSKSTGIMYGCYGRPPASETKQTIFNSSVTDTSDYHGGILVGKNSGDIDGCYHTSVYYTDSTVSNIADFGILVGWQTAVGSIANTYFSDTLITANKYLYYSNDLHSKGLLNTENPAMGWTDAEFKVEEGAGVYADSTGTNVKGTAKDSSAMKLSEGIYLGTYQLKDASGSNTNDGFPMLAGFELAKYRFPKFGGNSNLIMSVFNLDQNIENSVMMNAFCSFANFDFPLYAPVFARARLYTGVMNIPGGLNYNISAVAYGSHLLSNDVFEQQKWVIVDGKYSQKVGLANGAIDAVKGKDMVSNINNFGPAIVPLTNGTNYTVAPSNVTKIYVYVSILPESSETGSAWGVHHQWNSAVLQKFSQNDEGNPVE